MPRRRPGVTQAAEASRNNGAGPSPGRDRPGQSAGVRTLGCLADDDLHRLSHHHFDLFSAISI